MTTISYFCVSSVSNENVPSSCVSSCSITSLGLSSSFSLFVSSVLYNVTVDLYLPTEFSVVIFPDIVPPVNGSFSTSIIYILKVPSSALTLIKILVSSVILYLFC